MLEEKKTTTAVPKNGGTAKYAVTIHLQSRLTQAVYREVQEILADVDSICERDPAALGRAEVLFLYSGVHALLLYRLAHRLHEGGMKLSARALSQLGKFLTGIEIHPGAKIGRGLFIDHGAGVVIGETAVIGDNCTIYQGVTLGGTGKETGKRHPTLGHNVMVGAGAKLLGNFTVGSCTKIAAGAVVLGDVPSHATAVGIPAKVVRRRGEKVVEEDLDQVHIPDPIGNELAGIRARLERLEAIERGEDAADVPEEGPVYPTATAEPETDPAEESREEAAVEKAGEEQI